jgi:hypothetical protein
MNRDPFAYDPSPVQTRDSVEVEYAGSQVI